MALQWNSFTGTLDYVGTGGGGGSITGGGTATEVAFFTAATAIGSDAGLFYLPVSGGGPRLGIGIAANLLADLHTQQNVAAGANSQHVILDQYNAGATGALLIARRSSGIPGTAGAVKANAQMLTLNARGDDGTGTIGADGTFFTQGNRVNIILGAGSADWTSLSNPTQIDFNTTNLGSTSVSTLTPRMRIGEDGTIFVNTTTPVSGSRVVITGGALHVLAGNALRLQGAGAGFSSFVDPTHAANIPYTLPATQGPAGTMLTNVDGAGTLDWRPAPAGLPGEDGIDGDPGPPGVTGATGPQGATGNTGNTGATGAPGLHGMDGIDGDDGMAFPIPGVQGPQGIQGIQGIQGVQGLQGFMGIPGSDGLDGEEGLPMPGIPGPQGVPGALGPQGVQGPPGLSDDGGGGSEEWLPAFPSGSDLLPQYLLLAGRPGTTNNPVLSTTANGTITGSGLTSGSLNLQGSAATTPTGTINLWPNATTVPPSGLLTALEFAPTLTLQDGASVFGIVLGNGAAWTIDAAAASVINFIGLTLNPTLGPALGANQTITTLNLFADQTIFTNDAAATLTLSFLNAFFDTPLFQPAGVMQINNYRGFFANPRFAGAGVTNMTNCTLFNGAITTNAGGQTITTLRGLNLGMVLGAGTVNLAIGIDIAALAATTAISFRSLGSAAQMRHAGGARFGSGTLGPTGSSIVHVDGGYTVKRTAPLVGAFPYTLLLTDYYLAVTDTTAARTVNLPSAATAAAGKIYIVKDESGAAGTNNITVSRSGADTIDAALTTVVINTNSGVARFYSDGGTKWYTW